MSTFELLEAPRATAPRAGGDGGMADAHGVTPWGAPGPRRYTVLQTIVAVWRLWSERQKSRRELATLDARMLRDIGVSPEMVDFELRQPAWRPLRDWRALRDGRSARRFTEEPRSFPDRW